MSTDTIAASAAPHTDPVRRATARLAVNTRFGASPEALDDMRRDLTAAKLERAIRLAIAAAPPLTNDQRVSLGHMLTSGGAR